jgi:phosphatidylserine decarboxylase
MVLDGILYAAGLTAAGVFAAYLGGAAWGAPLWALAGFALYFFRDPDRVIPAGESAVSPADGRVVEMRAIEIDGQTMWKISIFLSIFDVHVNRSPIEGIIREQAYQRGRFRVASRPEASVDNEQNAVTIAGERTVVLKQIAGAVARRIVFTKRVGDRVQRGERIGLIKFGSRVDLLLPLDYAPRIAVGQRVRGGSSIVADLVPIPAPLADTTCAAAGHEGHSLGGRQ